MKGFTLLELMLSIAIMAVVTGIGAPLLTRSLSKNDLDASAETWANSLRRAQVLAQAIDGESSWGAQLQSGSITVFKGATYAGRDPDYDEVFVVPSTITPSGVTEVVMARLTGYPNTTGTTTISSSVDSSDPLNVTINSRGMVSY